MLNSKIYSTVTDTHLMAYFPRQPV